jgi:hypothetical protein
MQEFSQKPPLVMIDIRRPNFNYTRLKYLKTVHLATPAPPKERHTARRVFWGIVGFMFAGAGAITVLVALNFSDFKASAIAKGEIIATNIIESAEHLKELDASTAKKKLQQNQTELAEIESFIKKARGETLAIGLGGIFPAIRDGLGLIKNISTFNVSLIALTETVADLQTNGFAYFQNGGRSLINGLTRTKTLLGGLITDASQIQNKTARLKNAATLIGATHERLSDEYVTYASQFHLWDEALESIIAFLDTKVDRQILLLFQNNSEMRPAGGFIGSYGVLTVNEGQMANLEVQDIYWPDHPMNVDVKVIPPKPLQNITTDWGARDANWFFDFPTSARSVSYFLENSRVYKEPSITFDGVIAINTNVLGTLLKAVGPIPVEEYELVITDQNFLEELQREVETGKDKSAGDNPKKILSVVAPELIERLDFITTEQKTELQDALIDHVKRKDIMITINDSKIANLLETFGLDGAVQKLPQQFWGSYLAVVNANIAGGKSDAFTDQYIAARVDVATDGSAFTDVQVIRTHKGGSEKDWWYNADNQSYIQIYTNPNTELVSLEGNTAKRQKITNYGAEYTTSSLVTVIEETITPLVDFNAESMKAFGKHVVAAWLTTKGGETSTLHARYHTRAENEFIVRDGKVYRFIFEKQSGANTTLKVTIQAPLGYIWQESEDSVFTFETQNPLARETLDLHLAKVE